MRLAAAGVLSVLAACAPDAEPIEARAVPAGIEVRAAIPLDRVVVGDAAGVVLATRRLPVPTREVVVPLRWSPGAALRAELWANGRSWTADVEVPTQRPPVDLRLEAPLGQGGGPLRDGDRVPLMLVEGGSVQVGLVATAWEPATVRATLDGEVEEAALAVPGARGVLTWTLDETEPAELVVETCPTSGEPCQEARATLRPEPVAPGSARARLVLHDIVFPADPIGSVDPSRPPDRVQLPSPWWRAVLRTFELGYRPLDSQAPWAWQAVRLENRGDRALTVVVRARVLGADGTADPAFRPRLRDADDGTGNVSVLLHLPPGQMGAAALPVFVDETAVAAGTYQREIEVLPLGAREPVYREQRPLVVRRGSSALSLGFLAATLASLGGLGLTLKNARRWLAGSPTSDLMRISLFGSLMFVVSAVSQLLAMGASAVLGPFSALVTGLVDDALRTTLFATLLCLLPRPGVATLALATASLLRALALGSMGPVELLFFGSHALLLEGALWISGITRHVRWRAEGPLRRWARLGLAFAGSSALHSMAGLVHSAVLYRLFYADWYVAALVALPGFLYPLAACALASRFADSLRRVEA